MPLTPQPPIPENRDNFAPEKPFKPTPEEKRAAGLGLEEVERVEIERPPATEVEIKPSEEIQIGPAPAAPTPPPSPRPAKAPHLIEIEKILEEDLKDTFLDLPLEKQKQFKAEGERVAGIIWQMIETAKVQVKKIIKLIRGWLKIIPGINRFFLEQETKIKTDRIIELARKRQR